MKERESDMSRALTNELASHMLIWLFGNFYKSAPVNVTHDTWTSQARMKDHQNTQIAQRVHREQALHVGVTIMEEPDQSFSIRDQRASWAICSARVIQLS